MATDIPPVPGQPVKKKPWLLYGCGVVVVLLLAVITSVAITLWWLQRPIKPVVLSPQEKAAVEQKLRYAEAPNPPGAHPEGKSSAALAPAVGGQSTNPEERRYIPGGKVVKLTEREINGLLNANTDLGHSVRLEFARDAINAYLVVPIPKDFPIAGGKMFRARGRFRVSIGNGGAPYAILEDVTIYGLSLPKAWLGGLKGENLIGDALGKQNGAPVLKGVKSLRVEPGALVLEVEG